MSGILETCGIGELMQNRDEFIEESDGHVGVGFHR